MFEFSRLAHENCPRASNKPQVLSCFRDEGRHMGVSAHSMLAACAWPGPSLPGKPFRGEVGALERLDSVRQAKV